jgi:hypothetical protein
MQRVHSLDRLLRSVDGVVKLASVFAAGEALMELEKLEKGSKWP